MKWVVVLLMIALFSGCVCFSSDTIMQPEVPVLETKPEITEEDVLVVESEDKMASLEIPKSALPEHITINDIKITKAPRTNVFDENVSSGVAYNIEPDGLTLAKSVKVSVTHNIGQEKIIPLLFHISNDDIELIDDTTVLIDEINGNYTITGEINHFSSVGTDEESGIFKYETQSGGSALIGEKVSFILKIWPEYKGRKYYWHKTENSYSHYTDKGTAYYYQYAPGTQYVVKEINIEDWSGVLKPAKVKTKEKVLKEDEVFIFETQFTCMKKGWSSLYLKNGKVEFRKLLGIWDKDGPKETYDVWGATVRLIIVPSNYQCEEKEEMIYLGPQYFIDCGGGHVLTGYYKNDEQGNRITDANGNGYDSETGELVVCPE